MATVIIWGSSGRSGQAMLQTARARGHQVIAPTHSACDLRDTAAITDTILTSRADIVINCAATSGLEACAVDPLAAHLINAAAPAAMALACRHSGAQLVHLSTDYVLSGHKPGLKSENAPCKPICTYGESKREAELSITEANPRSLILRVSWLCGNPHKPGFPESIAAKALAGHPLAAIADKYSLPTDVYELAQAALQLAEEREQGTWHLCSTGAPLSCHHIAQLTLRALMDAGALPQAPHITPQQLNNVPFFREPRPRHTAMDNARLRARGIHLSPAEDTIRNAVQRWLEAR